MLQNTYKGVTATVRTTSSVVYSKIRDAVGLGLRIPTSDVMKQEIGAGDVNMADNDGVVVEGVVANYTSHAPPPQATWRHDGE